ncbi:unnamed protein product [Cylindrotheca closterium]|uniref:Uncharacterized protein n=1 Tax=Cylindrotheca closterium TaxID=2856 RepID=A0AAD2CGV7_9STRA|nr:unnamed protein product [Cylindrotheca closterium]
MTAVDDFDPAANIHYAALNNEITRELTALGLTFRDVENDNLPWVQIAEISFEKEVEPFFLDASGNKVEKPYVNGCSEDIIWTTFWVVQKGYSFYSQQSDDLVFVGRAKKTPSTGASAVQSASLVEWIKCNSKLGILTFKKWDSHVYERAVELRQSASIVNPVIQPKPFSSYRRHKLSKLSQDQSEMGLIEDFNNISIADTSGKPSVWKRVIKYPDHRTYVCFPCPRGVKSRDDIKLEFKSSTEIVIKRRLPVECLDTTVLLDGITTVCSDSNTHDIVLVKSAQEQASNAGVKLENVKKGTQTIWNELDTIKFDFKTTKKLLDPNGNHTTRFYVGSDGGDTVWVTFWVEKENDLVPVESNDFQFVGTMFKKKRSSPT